MEQKVAQAAQSLAGALPITDEQALTLVKSGFTNLEGLRDADVSRTSSIFSAWTKQRRRKFTRRCHREVQPHNNMASPDRPAMSRFFRNRHANKNDDQDHSAQARDLRASRSSPPLRQVAVAESAAAQSGESRFARSRRRKPRRPRRQLRPRAQNPRRPKVDARSHRAVPTAACSADPAQERRPETVSLIDEKKPRPKRAEGDEHDQALSPATDLADSRDAGSQSWPPISAAAIDLTPAGGAAQLPRRVATDATGSGSADAATEAEDEAQRSFTSSRRSSCKDLAPQLGLKNHVSSSRS